MLPSGSGLVGASTPSAGSLSAPTVSVPATVVTSPTIPAVGTSIAPAVRRFSTGFLIAVSVCGITLVLVLGTMGVTLLTVRWARESGNIQSAGAPTPLPGTPTVTAPGASPSAVTPQPGAGSTAPAAAPATPPTAAATPPAAATTPPGVAARGAIKGTTVEPAPASRGRVTNPDETAAAERLDIAQAKIANNLLDLAIADLQQIVQDYPTTRAAADAGFLGASLLEQLGRADDAMAAHLEFGRRFRSDPRVADSKLRLADLTLRSRRPNRELAARDVLSEIVRESPRTPQALQALNAKMKIENDRRLRERDPVLGIDVPAVLVTERTLTEQFPTHPSTMIALNRLAGRYMEINQYQHAAQALSDLATRFPTNGVDAWFRLGELYERRLKDPARARGAYSKVPPGSARYRDAQRKLKP